MALNFQSFIDLRMPLDRVLSDMRTFLANVKKLESELDKVSTKKTKKVEFRPEQVLADFSQAELSVEGIEKIGKQFNQELAKSLLKQGSNLKSVFQSIAKNTKGFDLLDQTTEIRSAIDQRVKGLEGYGKQAKSLQTDLRQLSISAINLNKNLGKAQSLEDFKRVAAQAGSAAKQLTSLMSKLKQEGNLNVKVQDNLNLALDRYVKIQHVANQGVAKAQAQIKQMTQALRAQNVESDEFTNRLDIAIFKLIRYRVAFTVLHGAILQIKDTVKVFAEVDHAVAQLAKVLPPVGTNVNEIRDAAFRMGKQFGISITEVLSGMNTWAQLGFNQVQILKATEAALIGVNTTGLTNAQITDAMTAAIFSYGVKVENVTEVVDKWMAVQARFAVTGADLANALFKVGSAAEDFGLTIDQLNGIITAIGTVTRATGSEVGNAFKTILTRLPQEDTIKAFQNIGVAVFKSANQFRNFFDVLGDVAKKWPDLTDAERADIAQRAAGVRQYAKFIALMNTFSLAQQAVAVSQTSMGASFAANIIETQTLEKSWQGLVTQADELKFKIGQDLAKPISVLIDLLKALDANSAVGGAFAKLASGAIATGTAFVTFYGTVLATKFVLRQLAKEGLFLASREMALYVKSMQTATFMTRGFAVALFNLKQIITGLFTTMQGWLFLVSTAIGIFTIFGNKVEQFSDNFTPFEKSQAEFAKSLAESVVAQDKYISSLVATGVARTNDIASIGKLIKGTDEYNKKIRNLSEGQDELKQISVKAADAVEGFIKGVISEKEALDRLNESIDAVVGSKEKQLAKDRELLQVQLARLLEQAGAENLKAAANIRVLEKSLQIANPRLDEFANSLSLLKIDRSQLKTFEDISKAAQNLLPKQQFSSVDKQVAFVRDIADNIGSEASRLGVQIDGFMEEFFRIVDIPDEELKKNLESRLRSLKGSFQSFAKGIQTIPSGTDQEKQDFVAKFLLRLDLLQAEAAPILELLKSEIQDSINLSDQEAKQLFKSIGEIQDVLRAPTNGQGEHIVDFKKPSEETRNFVNKIIDLKKSILDGRNNIEALVDISFKSGGALKSLSAELARFYEQSAVDIRNLSVELDTRLAIAIQKRDELQAKVNLGPKVLDVAVLEQARKELDIQKADVELLTQRKQLMGELLSMLGSVLNNAKAYNGVISISNDRIAAITAEVENYADLTKEITSLLTQSGLREEEVLKKEQERFAVFTQLKKKQTEAVDVTEQEAFARRTAVELTEEQLNLLSRIATLDLSRSIARLSDGIKAFRSDLAGAFSDIPDLINEGYTKRRDMQDQIFEAEQDLMQARKDGDQAAIQTAQNKLDKLREEARDYRAIWFEIKGIVENLFSSVSTSAFNAISEKFAEDLANLQIGGASLGEQMGKSISAQFDISSAGLINAYQKENDRLLGMWDVLHKQYLIELSKVLQRPLPELNPFGPATPENITSSVPFGPPVPQEMLDAQSFRDNVNKAFRSGSVLAGQTISNYIGRSGSEFGQTVAGFLQTVTPTLFPQQFGAGSNPLNIIGLGVGTGILGSLISKLFGQDDRPERDLIRSVDKNTEAIEANTISLKEFSKGIFNAPPNFNFTGPSGSVPVGGSAGNISIQVNVNQAGATGQQIADVVLNELNRVYRINQGAIGTRSTRVI